MTRTDSPVTLETAQAERELLACGIRKPQVWDRIQHVQPEWFTHWSDIVLWRAVQFSYEQNGGFDVAVVERWLHEYYPDDASALLERLATIADEFLHAEYLDYYVATLERSGERLATQRWARHIAEMCDGGFPMHEIYRVVQSPPIQNGGDA